MKYFWAKTTKDGKPGISVYEHMINVGCVARCIAEIAPELLKRFQLLSVIVGVLAALHDLGKISPGFQRKCEDWLEENRLTKIAQNGCWDTMTESDHGKVSHAVIQEFLLKIGIQSESAKCLATALGAHHGKIKFLPNSRGIKLPGITDNFSGIDWSNERLENAERVWEFFQPDNLDFIIDEDSPVLWWLAGLTSVADWIGSDERYFPVERGKSFFDPKEAAINALDSIGFKKIECIQGLSFHDLFHDSQSPDVIWRPNEMQEKTYSIVNGPGVYVVEAPMGMGKTEAALWAAYKLISCGKAKGIYFALPTQATSNRMHLRMQEFIKRITGSADNSSRLIHGNSWLMDESIILKPVNTSIGINEEDAKTGRDWFSSSKRALIAPFGVGTIDQALLGVVAAKHFFVRYFALAGKVVILDEIHSYDLYTGTLIDKLITTLEGLGCTVIVLSATLSGKRRSQIVSCSFDETEEDEIPYPLITGRSEGIDICLQAAKPTEDRTIKIDFISETDAQNEAIYLAQKGGAVLWICDTIGTAQKQYQEFKKSASNTFPIGLLHSRFPYWRREEIENEWMERLGKDGKTRCGSILISTQIVEQSVDLDADLIISELAPTDMMLQRLGRLWRHQRDNRPIGCARFCILAEKHSVEEYKSMDANKIKASFESKSNVYAPYVLLRTLEVWEKIKHQISIPSHIRQLISSTYKEKDNEPESWVRFYNDWFGTDSAKEFLALRNSNIWQIALEDREGNQTRLNELQTVSLVLLKQFSKQGVIFIDGTNIKPNRSEFSISLAQAIHKNLVKVPEYCFDNLQANLEFKEYLHGLQTAGIVEDDGDVNVKGLKPEYRLFYSDELGLVINKTS